MTKTDLPHDAPHPGEVLWEEYLKPMGVSQVEFARHIGVSFRRVNEIVNGKRAITPETAFLFSQALGCSPRFWMDLQSLFDLVKFRRANTAAAVKKMKASPAGLAADAGIPANRPGRRHRAQAGA